MPDIIDTWSNDHKNFAHLLNILEAEVDSFLNARNARYDLMLDILHYMTHYPDIFHHPKEDLVSARVRELDADAGTVVDELARQHVILRESGARLFELLEEVMDGAMLKRQSIEAPARAYIKYFRKHMEMEESDVFPVMRALLGKADWEAIEKTAPFKEDPLFGSSPLENRYDVLRRQITQAAENYGTV